MSWRGQATGLEPAALLPARAYPGEQSMQRRTGACSSAHFRLCCRRVPPKGGDYPFGWQGL